MRSRYNPDTSIRLEEAPKILGQLASGQKVFDRPNSHIHDLDPELIIEALGNIDAADRDFIVESVDLGRVVGQSQCVETSVGDTIIFAQREGRHGLSRFVINKEKTDTSFITIILKKTDEGYVAITAFTGPAAEREPWDRNIMTQGERNRSEQFWNTHALVWDGKSIIPGTERR